MSVDGEDAVQVSEVQVPVEDTDETITALCTAASQYILCSSFNSVYVISRRGSRFSCTLTVHHLVARANLLVGLLQTGFKLFGLSSDTALAPAEHIFKILPVPNTNYILTCGSRFSLWADWHESGRESIVWEAAVQKLLQDDLAASFGCDTEQTTLHDVFIQPTSVASTHALLAVLSSVQSRAGRQLFLHLLDAELSAFNLPVTIRTRVLLDSAMCTSDAMKSASMQPSFHRASSSVPEERWRVALTWVSGGTATLSALAMDLHAISQGAKKLDVSIIAYEFETDIKGPDMAALGRVEGVDGLVAITLASELRVVSPMYYDHQTRTRDLAALTTAAPDASLRELLQLVSSEQVKVTENVIANLRRRVEALSAVEVDEAVLGCSGVIVNRSALGTHWGSEVAADKEQTFQLVHHQVRDKFAEHARLLQVLAEVDISERCRRELHRHHQDAGLLVGFCDSITETVIRSQSIAPAAKDDFSSLAFSATLLMAEQGMKKHIRGHLELSEAQLRSQGLSNADAFFAKADSIREGMEAVSAVLVALRDKQVSPRTPLSPSAEKLIDIGDKPIHLLAGAYGLAATFATALNGVSQDTFPGAADVATAAINTKEVFLSWL